MRANGRMLNRSVDDSLKKVSGLVHYGTCKFIRREAMQMAIKNGGNVRTPYSQEGRRQSKWLLIWACAFFVYLPMFISSPARGQTLFGSIVGTVTDTSGAAVPDATVLITSLQTNETRSVQTDRAGVYTVSTVAEGTYRVSISKQGFRTFENPGALVTANNEIRINAQLEVGVVSQTVEVQSAATAQLQTDTAEVHSDISTQILQDLPQPTRTYQGVFNLVPGMSPPGGQLTGGTNNPSKSMTYSANGSGQGGSVRIEGVSANSPWGMETSTYVPSVESIESVNVVTSSAGAEQGFSAGTSVNVQLRSGSNSFHGAFYEYNITNATEARNFFQPVGQAVPHLVDNDAGGWASGPIIRNKLFYFGGYEGDYLRQGLNGTISVPTATMLAGDLSGSTTPIYDPNTGNADGTGRTPFPGNIIPANRISPIVNKLVPYFPTPNLPGIENNYNLNQGFVYNLHKIDTKIDYVATSKLRVSGRWAYQPYYTLAQPLYGPVLGGASGGWPAFAAAQAGNYLQHGATLAISGSATYVASPTLVFDATFGVTRAHQLLYPTEANVRYGADVLGIPGTNVGALPWSGGMPDFTITGYGNPTFGESYPPLEYSDPVFEYTANVTKVKGSHSIRAGVDLKNQHFNHHEHFPDAFTFTGGVSALTNGPASPNLYNSVADFLLGLPQTMSSSYLNQMIIVREWDYGLYVRDQWQMTHKFTVNYGLRWEHYPVPTSPNGTIAYNNLESNPTNDTLEICGQGGDSSNCGMKVSWKIFAPSLGIAYRPTNSSVVRAGYSLSPDHFSETLQSILAYPSITQTFFSGASSNLPAGSLTTGIPVLPPPDISAGTIPIPYGTGNANSSAKNYIRGYAQSYNLTYQQNLGFGFVGSVGYVGTHAINNSASSYVQTDINYGQLGGGPASQPFSQFGIFGPLAINGYGHQPWDKYNSLQTSLAKQFTNGLAMQLAYTWSKDMQGGVLFGQVEVPQYQALNTSVTPTDRTNNFIVSTTYQLPFGSNKPFVDHGIGAAVLGGWTVNGVFFHVSGLAYSIVANGTSCNCPGSTQRANQVKSQVAKVGNGVSGNDEYFDPTAFAPVNTVSFGSAGYYSQRGPGATNLDANVFRDFHLYERLTMQFRAEAFNVTNTPHFGNPGNNINAVSYNPDGSIANLNGFSQITNLNPLGRLIDPRYMRFGVRFSF